MKNVKNKRQLATFGLGLVGAVLGVGVAYLMRAAGAT